MDKIQSLTINLPKLFKVGINKNWTALVNAIGGSDNNVVTQLQNTQDQLFVPTANGIYLDGLASNYGVSRPLQLSLSDSDFSKLVPILSFEPKQIRNTMIDLFNVVWGESLTHANITSINFAPFNVSPGDTITIIVNNQTPTSFTAQASQIATPGAATAQEIVNIINSIPGITASIYTTTTSSNEYINIQTNAIGAAGAIQVIAGGMVSATKLNLPTNRVQIQSISPHCAIYEINNKELIFEIPALVPLLKRTLLGSHHWHPTYAIAPPEPPTNDIWVGSFMYSRSIEPNQFTVTGKVASLQEGVTAGNVYTTLLASNASNLPNTTGYLIFDFGLDTEEQPVKYFGVPNSNLIFIDPEHVFKYNHNVGSNINYLSQLSDLVPASNGSDYAIYFTSPVTARDTAESLVETLIAAGVIATFAIQLPSYYYPIANPYSQ